MHIVTRPFGGKYHVVAVRPGLSPKTVATCDCDTEALAVRDKLDSVIDCITEEPIPEDMDDLLCMI